MQNGYINFDKRRRVSVAMCISPRDGRLKVQSVFLGGWWTEIPSFFPGSADFTKKKEARCMSVEKKKKNPVRGKKPNRVGAIKRGERLGIILGG